MTSERWPFENGMSFWQKNVVAVAMVVVVFLLAVRFGLFA